MKKSRIRQSGFTLLELMVVVAIIAIIASIAIPLAVRSKLAANEAAAIGAMRALSSAQESFKTTSGFNTYGTLNDLASAIPPYIDASLAAGKIRGYTLVMVAAGLDTWAATSSPNTLGKSGNRSFYIDEYGTITFSMDGTPPNATSPTLQSSPSLAAVVKPPSNPGNPSKKLTKAQKKAQKKALKAQKKANKKALKKALKAKKKALKKALKAKKKALKANKNKKIALP